ncbi:MAG: hypothetical protein AAF747_03670 [Planctomycetota bacterium]
MPRRTTRSSNDVATKITDIRRQLETLPSAELVELLNRVRDDEAQRVLAGFDEAWDAVRAAADQHYALTGSAIPAPATIDEVFASDATPATRREQRPDAWYNHEISFAVRAFGDEGATREFIGNWITARGGDCDYARRTILPQLVESGLLAHNDDGVFTLANAQTDAWYDFNVLGFINSRDAADLPTAADIHNYIIEQGGHGVEVFTTVLPRLQSLGRITERADGLWDTTTRRPDAWYDFTISAFIESSDPASPPSTKDVHDHVIERGGHGVVAVTEALPRLRDNGILTEVEDGRWDSARRKPEAWYEFQVMSFLNELDDDSTASSKQLHDFVIEQGGHGVEVVAEVLPRLRSAGRVSEVNDGEWAPTHRRPAAWYDHVVMSAVRACDADALPTLKQLHDTVIERGGHGALVATEVLPRLVEAGEITEVDHGVYDVTNRRSDAWYEQTVYSFVEQADDAVTTMQVYEHVIEQGGHGSQIVQEVFPQLVRSGLLNEVDDGTWEVGNGIPLALLETQTLRTIRDARTDGASLEDCLDGMDEDLADAAFVQPVLDALTAAGTIERDESDDEPRYRMPGTMTRPRRAAADKQRTRRRRAA